MQQRTCKMWKYRGCVKVLKSLTLGALQHVIGTKPENGKGRHGGQMVKQNRKVYFKSAQRNVAEHVKDRRKR